MMLLVYIITERERTQAHSKYSINVNYSLYCPFQKTKLRRLPTSGIPFTHSVLIS